MSRNEWNTVEALYMQYRPRMLRQALRYVDGLQDAEDVISITWMWLLQHLPQINKMDENARSSYIMKCVHNDAVDYIRADKRENAKYCLPEHEPKENVEMEIVDHRQLQDLLGSFLCLLSPKERRVVELKIHGYDDEEIA